MPNSDDDWLFDYIVEFLRSPPWVVPINDFMDERCVVFDDEAEHKLAHQEVHMQFCELIENLLTNALEELGVTGEQFVAACERGQSSNSEVTKLIFSQILAADDFLVFKKMMVQRSQQLELEVLEALRDGRLAGSAMPVTPVKAKAAPLLMSPNSAADPQVRAAYEESHRLAIQQEEEARRRDKSHANDVERALQASMTDSELAQRQLEAEQAEIEHAIALSLAMEAERLKMLRLEQEQKDKVARAEAQAKLEAAKNAEEEKAAKKAALELAAKQAEEQKAAAEKAAAAKTAAAEKAKADLFNLKNAPSLSPVKTDATALDNMQKRITASNNTSANTSGLPALSSSFVSGGHNRRGSLEPLAKTYERVNEQFILNKKIFDAEPVPELAAKKPIKKQMDKAELQRRKEFLKAQRAKIVAMKKEQNKAALDAFTKSEKKTSLKGLGDMPAISQKTKKHDDWTSNLTSAKNVALTSALSTRVKQDVLLAGPKKNENTVDDNLAKLAALNELRAKNAKSVQAMVAAKKKQQELALSMDDALDF